MFKVRSRVGGPVGFRDNRDFCGITSGVGMLHGSGVGLRKCGFNWKCFKVNALWFYRRDREAEQNIAAHECFSSAGPGRCGKRGRLKVSA